MPNMQTIARITAKPASENPFVSEVSIKFSRKILRKVKRKFRIYQNFC